MKNILFSSVTTAFRIWITAVLINTILGCLLLEFSMFWFGLLFSAIFSLPVLFFLCILLYLLFNRNASVNWIMGALMLTAIAGGYLSMLFFESELDFVLEEFRVIAMIAGLIAVTVYKPAMKEVYDNNNEIKTTQNENNMV